MSLPFIDRIPSAGEIERFRLILSTYQDGSGMLKNKDSTLPGWRDYERTVAAAFRGTALESKWIYDVILSDAEQDLQYGISCKMRGLLKDIQREGRVKFELSNASGEFWDSVKKKGVTQENYHNYPDIVGATIIEVVERWHINVGLEIDNTNSFFLVLQWDKKSGRYQLFQYPIDLPEPTSLNWSVESRRLIGRDSSGVLMEWYGLSGGQLKYYPSVQSAVWHSSVFQLEPLPNNIEYGLQLKATTYYPVQWKQANEK